MSYTQADKQQAVNLYITEGIDTAVETVGCSKRSIYNWLGEYCVDVHDEKAVARRTETARRHEAKRQAIREHLLDKTLDLLDRMDAPHVDFKGQGNEVTYPRAPADAVRAYATSVGILIDKYRLETGEYTDRTYREGSDDVDRRIQQLVGELERRAEAEAREKYLASTPPAGTNPTG